MFARNDLYTEVLIIIRATIETKKIKKKNWNERDDVSR